MPQYTIHVSDGSQQNRTIEARDEQEATKAALTAMSVHISSNFPPPERVEITITDAYSKEWATLRFGYEGPATAVRDGRLQ
ncbi:hypothetical protein [Rhizobium sp.]